MSQATKETFRFRKWMWIGVAVAVCFCSCLGIVMFANRENPSAVPTIWVEDLATAAASLASPTPLDSAQTVHLSLFSHIEGDMLTIEGLTDLPNRAILMYEVSEVSPNPTIVEGTVPVLDGRYSRQVDLTGWPAGTIAIWVGFQTLLEHGEKQPSDVIERFGEMGEFLYGENITETDGLKRVEVMNTLEFTPR